MSSESKVNHSIKYALIFTLSLLLLSTYVAPILVSPAIMILWHINVNALISLLGASYITLLGYKLEHINDKSKKSSIIDIIDIKYFLASPLIALCVLGFLSINQLIVAGIILDLALLWKYETMERSLLLLPIALIDSLAKLGPVLGPIMRYIFALSWAAAPAILSLRFLPHLITFFGSLFGVFVPLLEFKVAMIAFATFATIFFLAKKNLKHNVYDVIIKEEKEYNEIAKKNNDKNFVTKINTAKILLLGLMYWSVKGASVEWATYFAFYMSYNATIAITLIAGLTLCHFLAKRVNETIDVMSKKSFKKGNRPYRKDLVMSSVAYMSTFALVFSALNIIRHAWIVTPVSSAIIAILFVIEYRETKDISKTLGRIFLVGHGTGESLVTVAGLRKTLPAFMLPIVAIALTFLEVLADSVHEHDEDDIPNLKKLGIEAAEIIPCMNIYGKDISTLKHLGYEKQDYSSKDPDVSLCGYCDLASIISIIKNRLQGKITMNQAVSLIFLVQNTFEPKDLINSGFTQDEVIASKIFSKKQLSNCTNIQKKEESLKDYKAIITRVMLENLSQTRGSSDKKLITKECLTRVEVGFTEEEVIDSNIFTTKELRKLGFNCEHYSSQLSLTLLLTVVSLVFINYNPILLAVGLASTFYYVKKLWNYKDNNVDNKFKLKMIQNHFVSYASYITAFSLSLNGGMECLDVFGCSIYMALAVALAGVIIESSVYFDELMKDNGTHNHGSIKNFIPSPKSFLAYVSLSVAVFALYNAATLLSLPIGLIAQIAVIVWPLTFNASYDKMHAILEGIKVPKSIREWPEMIDYKKVLVLLSTLANITFSIATFLGYSIAFAPMLALTAVALNASLLMLFRKEKPVVESFVNVDDIHKGCNSKSCFQMPIAKSKLHVWHHELAKASESTSRELNTSDIAQGTTHKSQAFASPANKSKTSTIGVENHNLEMLEASDSFHDPKQNTPSGGSPLTVSESPYTPPRSRDRSRSATWPPVHLIPCSLFRPVTSDVMHSGAAMNSSEEALTMPPNIVRVTTWPPVSSSGTPSSKADTIMPIDQPKQTQ